MGYRTVVMLSNDRAHEWANDPELGQKINLAMNSVGHKERSDLGYGRVVECVHADTVTLATLNFYEGFSPLAYTGYTDKNPEVNLLKQAADSLGYRLVKKSVKK